MKLPDFSILKSAIFSEDRKYRYALWRIWNINRPMRLQIGLNPSSANELMDDPTITRGVVRASKDGFGGFIQANLYSYVSTNPKRLLELPELEAIGTENEDYLKFLVGISGQTVCGWGSFPAAIKRAPAVLKMIAEPYCLGINADGQPKHPLYIGYDVPVKRFCNWECGVCGCPDDVVCRFPNKINSKG